MLTKSRHSIKKKPKNKKAAKAVAKQIKPKYEQNGCTVYFGDNLDILPTIQDKNITLAYIDPPFNTGKKQIYKKIKALRSENGSVQGYGNNRYETSKVSEISYEDSFDDFTSFLEPRIKEAYKLLAKNGSFFLHVDYREVHYCKVMMDKIFGRENFMNEIIWSYDYGARSKSKWSAKHDNILWYVKNKEDYIFNYENIDRIPYMAPGLVGKEKAKLGKTPTDVWWHTIVGTNSYERKIGNGYPTQKPLAILERIVVVHSNEGDTVLDFFAGSGTTGIGAIRNKRKAILIDRHRDALKTIKQRIKEKK